MIPTMVLYVLQWKVGFNLTDEASPPKLFPSRCTYSMGKSYSTEYSTCNHQVYCMVQYSSLRQAEL